MFKELLIAGAVMATQMPASANPSTTITAVEKIEIVSAWEYGSKEDSMRDLTYSFAHLGSKNTVDFDFPYQGGSQLVLSVTKKNKKLHNIRFTISKGQLLCNSMECEGSVRFDKGDKKGKIEKLDLSESADNSSDLVFVTHEKSFLEKIKKSDQLIIELPFYQHGNKQFTFDLKGFNPDF